MPEQDIPSDMDGDNASHRLSEGLKCCQSMVNNYREMIGRAVEDGYGQRPDDPSTKVEN